jgi:divalent metal cation (Fe/Co/Zn/Cd) transporter
MMDNRGHDHPAKRRLPCSRDGWILRPAGEPSVRKSGRRDPMHNTSASHRAHPPSSPALTHDWARIGLWLVASTMAYNVAEGVIALWAGVQASSIALVGFGLDSYIECAAAAALLWRLTLATRRAHPEAVERSEQRVHRFIGATFGALALYVLAQAGWTLWSRQTPEESLVGIILAVTSLVIMPLVARGKLQAAKAIGSAALRSEAKETLACSYLSLTLLLGLVANAVAGWWWADPLAALLMVPWLLKEGLEGVRGEPCCAH